MFLLRDKLILQGEKRETSAKNLKRNNVARQVKGFCIPYFAPLTRCISGATMMIRKLDGNPLTDCDDIQLNHIAKGKPAV